MQPKQPVYTKRVLLILAISVATAWASACVTRSDERSNAAPVRQTQTSSLWTQLQSGDGYVVMMRHALAPGVGDPSNFRLNDCSTQRNLSATGRQQAERIGKAFRDRKIPIASVRSSQWCRCLETAKLLNLKPVQAFPPLNSFFNNASTKKQQTEAVRRLILASRTTQGVTILVTHQVNITALTNRVPDSGESIVLRAKGQTIEVVGQLPPP
ncbi:histidine phosphatase family protein [Leptolyngbya sp. FACHB-321]|uniref:histidine phosphatase family protein n=1 Tax=Leptolyngbya sp. FACHB-321 TaxID=2692807 RepID=UPI001685B871|nr:histidine phosphatase family protein [Leptolyngbya sp. FACHB-321]MBD2035599.1 histidine phosphatase family protein [Leptolyngbya sp. FACHB-321]